jgi:hypothetical protein
MKPSTIFFYCIAIMIATIATADRVAAQQYKLRQVSSMMGMKSESTIYVKGMRKRTEGGGMMGIGSNLVTIEQCDKQRTVTLNDKKKKYFIDPFGTEEVNDEPIKPAAKTKPVTEKKTGGTIYRYFNITDTGERKKMFGFTARHVWTTDKMKPSADACMMKDSMLIKTDGWYIDLPEFNCPVDRIATTTRGGYQKPDCMDKIVQRRSGKGKLGFPLIEKRTTIMGGMKTVEEFVTDLETIELSTAKLDSMLFEIPPGYTEAKSREELEDKINMMDMMNSGGKNSDLNNKLAATPGEKAAGVTRIGVYEPKSDAGLQTSNLQSQLAGLLRSNKIDAVVITSEDDAKNLQCDVLLVTEIIKMKQASKVGVLLKAIKNTDPTAMTSYNIEAKLTVTNLTDGSVRTEQTVSGKYEGKADDAATKAMEEASRILLKALK